MTSIAPSRLTELRAEGHAQVTRFVDPHVIYKATEVIRRRGEAWAAAVLGKDLSRRSIAFPSLPYLVGGDDYTLVAADVEEDKAMFDAITGEPA